MGVASGRNANDRMKLVSGFAFANYKYRLGCVWIFCSKKKQQQQQQQQQQQFHHKCGSEEHEQAWAKMATEDLPPEHNVAIARMGFHFGTDGVIDMARRFQTCKITTMYFGQLMNISNM
jgi:hypothetical protein